MPQFCKSNLVLQLFISFVLLSEKFVTIFQTILLLQTSFGLILNYCCPQEEFVNNALQFFKGNGYELLLYDQLKIDRGMYYTAQC